MDPIAAALGVIGLESALSSYPEKRAERHIRRIKSAYSKFLEARPKRLIVCCDGTTNDGVNTKKPITNVARIARCIDNESKVVESDRSERHIAQIVFYLRGVGTGTSFLTNTVDGVYGRGISSTIRESYAFICLNWNPNDEIILIGFSRGAFAVRVVAQLINDVGLLKKDTLHLLNEMYDFWQRCQSGHRQRHHETPSAISSVQRKYEGKAHTKVRIKAVAVWDTVPALSGDKLAFVNESIPDCVDSAFHALALNEERAQFQPLLWKDPDNRKLKQCWFLGSHSDVGGGNEEQALANISLMWMISQLEGILGFNADSIRNLTRAPVWREVAEQRKSHKTQSEVSRVRMETGDFMLSLAIPVDVFQERTGVQVGWFAAIQRATGWSYRQPFSKGPETHEMIHWTVATLLRKQIVSDCKPLDRAVQKTRVGGGDGYDPPATPTYACSNLEREMLAAWIAFDCSQLIRINHERNKSPRTNGQVIPSSDLELSTEVLPIYLVLWEPEDWQVTNSSEHNHSVSVQVNGTLHLHYQHPRGNHAEEHEQHVEKVENLGMTRMNVNSKQRWWGKVPTLTGSIRVPFDQGLTIT